MRREKERSEERRGEEKERKRRKEEKKRKRREREKERGVNTADSLANQVFVSNSLTNH
jgi:hypothetical protein